MRCLKQLCIISGISFAGEVLAKLLPFPIPASVYGMILMLVLLQSKILKVEDIFEGSNLLLTIMPILFVPAGVGLIQQLPQLLEYAVAIVLVVVATTAIVMMVTGKTAELILGLQGKKDSVNTVEKEEK